MAQDTDPARRSGVGNFVDHIHSDEYLHGFRFNRDRAIETPSFLDIVDDWLVRGDATTACPTYERFLLTIVDIVDWWTEEDRKSVALVPLWPAYYDKQDPSRPEGARLSFGYGEHPDPRMGDPLPSGHRVLQRAYFEHHQQKHDLRDAETNT